jgi:hypothetical protein
MMPTTTPVPSAWPEARARVFISCGQAKDTNEQSTAHAIANRLDQLGFDPYVAVQEQTLRGLTENIFDRLARSEYYIFIDFKREELANTSPPVHRGSLFSHQELALAAYLRIPVLAFQEVGVKQMDGIMRFLQANATPFTDRNLLASVIADKVNERRWAPHWRCELELDRDPTQFSDANRVEQTLEGKLQYYTGRFFHIDVRNRHIDKAATNCYVYLSRVCNLATGQEIPLKTIEFKWAGYTLPNAHILPNQSRRFDAFWIDHRSPGQLEFNVFSDSTEYVPRVGGEGRYSLEYVVISDNFPPAKGTFTLNLGNSLDRTTLLGSAGATDAQPTNPPSH